MYIARHRTPDTGWAWVISLAIGAINGLTFGLIRSFGVFFFYLRSEFDISRQTAAWPFALCTSCTYLSGPITGFLISYFHLRTIVVVGVIFASAGFAACFLATDIRQIVLLVGVVHGFGNGLSYMQTPVIIAQYFNKYTATATAISYAGGTVGSFVFPALIEAVIAEYGLRGSFLIIGGILLNGLPCAMLLRPPIPVDSRRKFSVRVSEFNSGPKNSETFSKTLSKRSIRSIHFKLRRRKSCRDKWLFLRKSSIDLFIEKQSLASSSQTTEMEIGGAGGGFSISTSAISSFKKEPRFESVKTYQKHSKTMSYAFQETELLVMESMLTAKSRPLPPASPSPFGLPSPVPFGALAPVSPSIVISGTTNSTSPTNFLFPFRQDLSPTSATISSFPTPVTKNKYCQTDIVAKNSYFMAAIVSILTNPMYLILLITHVSFQWAWMTYQMIIFDFAIDLKLSRGQSVSILIGFAVADLVGRIISGWVADRGMIQKNHIVSICILCIGFFIQLTSMISSYRMHLTLSLFLGFTCGTIIVLFNLLTMEYVGLDHLPVALGLSAFFVGVTSLIRPYFIGLFRDVIGSYLGLFRFVGTLSFIAAFLWLMEPFAILHYKKRAKVKVQSSEEV